MKTRNFQIALYSFIILCFVSLGYQKTQHSIAIAPDYQKLIQGFWETKDGYGKIHYEGNKVNSPGQTMKITFKIEGNIITYTTENMSYKTKIIALTQEKFIEENEGYTRHWIRQD